MIVNLCTVLITTPTIVKQRVKVHILMSRYNAIGGQGLALRLNSLSFFRSLLIISSYRSCPEHSAADGLEDSYLATVYFLQHSKEFGVDPLRIAVIGKDLCERIVLFLRIVFGDKTCKLRINEYSLNVQLITLI